LELGKNRASKVAIKLEIAHVEAYILNQGKILTNFSGLMAAIIQIEAL
jgi:hypothetical protein